jgi:chemosensory pili system protein ChpA (sensor histidine kinase/response regulator)
MNLEHISIKHSALGWVKPLIEDYLNKTTRDLKQYIVVSDDSLMEGVRYRIDVVRGVSIMVEQYVSAMLSAEMLSLCDFISDHERVVENEGESTNTKQNDQALDVLHRSVEALSNYLKQVQSGHREFPFAIPSLLNDIQSIIKQGLLSEKLLLLPDLSMHSDDAEIDAVDDHANDASKQLIKKLRPAFQLSLLNVIKGNEVVKNLKRFEKICDLLEARSSSEQVARIWWIIGAFVESIPQNSLELDVSIKNLLSKVDALFRALLVMGERGLLKRQPIALIKNFLYYIAQPECDGPKCQAIKAAYRLEEFLPNDVDRNQLLNNTMGPNQGLLKTILEAVSNDVKVLKKTVEKVVDGDLIDVQKLRDVVPRELHIISDNLAMIGLGEQCQIVEAQIITVEKIQNDALKPDHEKIRAILLGLVQVEQALKKMQKLQSKVAVARLEVDALSVFELDNVLGAIVIAMLGDIEKIKRAILDLVKDPSCSENLELCVTLMAQLRGALLMLNKVRAVALMDALLECLNNYDMVEFSDDNRFDLLFQVVVSLASYLEALGEDRSDADSILDMADNQLSKLLVPVSTAVSVSSSERLELSVGGGAMGVDPTAPKASRASRSDKAHNSRIGKNNRPIVQAKAKGNLPKKGRVVPKHSKYRP